MILEDSIDHIDLLISKCCFCNNYFSDTNIPYDLPCSHIYCYECIRKITKENSYTLVCAIDKRVFNMEPYKIPISYTYIANKTDFELKNQNFKCSNHPDQNISFINLENNEYICDLCKPQIKKQNQLKPINENEIKTDLLNIENTLRKKENQIKNSLIQIDFAKTKKTINAIELKNLYENIEDFSEEKKVKIEKKYNFPSFKFEIETNKIIELKKRIPLIKIGGFFLIFIAIIIIIYISKNNFVSISPFDNSIILKNNNNSDFLQSCFTKQIKELRLLFRASEHDFLSKEFHKYCDDKGATLVLVESSRNLTFGGFNEFSWNSNNDYRSSDKINSFLFSLDLRSKYNYTFSQYDSYYYSYDDVGPFFHNDLKISDNSNETFSRSSLGSCYGEKYSGKSIFSDNIFSDKFFKVKEYEVFSIIFK